MAMRSTVECGERLETDGMFDARAQTAGTGYTLVDDGPVDAWLSKVRRGGVW